MATVNLGSLSSQLLLDLTAFQHQVKTAMAGLAQLKKALTSLATTTKTVSVQASAAVTGMTAQMVAQSRLQMAQLRAQTQLQVAQLQAQTQTQTAQGRIQAEAQAARMRAQTQLQVAQTRAQGQAQAAQIRGQAQVQAAQVRSAQAARTNGQAFLQLGTLMTGAFALRGVIDGLATFDQKVAEMRSVVAENTGFSEQAFAAMREEALRLGATTIFSAPQAAEAMTELSRAGFGANEVLQMIGPTLKMASIEHMNLAEASKIVSAALNQFNLPASQAQHITDLLTKGSAISATSVRGLGSALSFVGTTSSIFNVSAQESIAVLAGLAKGGIDFQRAGTGLRSVYLGLTQDVPKHTRVLQDMGLTYAQIDPKKVGLIESLRVLKEHQLDATRAMALFRANGATAVITMLQNLDVIDRYNVALGKAAGTTDRMAAVSTNNLRDAMTQLGNVFEVAWIKLGEGGLTGGLRGLVDGLTNALRALTGFLNPLAAGAATAYTLAAAIQAVSIALTALVAIKLGGAILAFLGTGVGLAVLAVGALAGAYALLTSEDTRYADQQTKVNTLLAQMGELSNASSQLAIDGLKRQAQATLDLMQIELERLKMAQPTAMDSLRNTGREAASFLSRAKQALFFGQTEGGAEATTVQDDRVKAMEGQIAAAQAALDRAKGLQGTPEVRTPKYDPAVDAYRDAKSRDADRKRAAKEALQAERERITALVQEYDQMAALDNAQVERAIEKVRLSGDIVRLAEAEGDARVGTLEHQRASTALQLAELKILQSSGKVIDQSDKVKLAGDIQELSYRVQTLAVEKEIAAMRGQAATDAAEYRMAARGIATARTTGEEDYRRSLGLTRLDQEEQVKAMAYAGASREAIQTQEVKNAIALQALEEAKTHEAMAQADAMLTAARSTGVPDNITSAEEAGKTALTNMLIAQREGANLQKDLARVPTTLGTIATEAVNDIVQAFTQGSADFGSLFSKIGQSFMQPFMTNMGSSIQGLTKSLFGSLSESTQNLIGAGIGAAFVGISTLFKSQKAEVESLGEGVKENIESTERTRGLIAGDSSVAISQISENLSQAMRPTVEVLLRMEMLLRLIYGGNVPTGAPVMQTNQLYASEVLASVRLG